MTVEAREEKMVAKYKVNDEEVKLSPTIVKKYLVNGNAEVTDQEVVMFMKLCQHQRLNPFLNEAYLVKFKNNRGGEGKAQIIVSKETYMKRAERASGYDGFEAGVILDRNGEIVEEEGSFTIEGDKLLGGWAKVYKKDRSRPYTAKISMKEYSKGQSTWNAMPATMIRKTAIVQALREAFPEDLGALYTQEESDQIHMSEEEIVEREIKEKANKKPLSMKKEEPEEDQTIEAEYEEVEESKEESPVQQNISDLQEPGF